MKTLTVKNLNNVTGDLRVYGTNDDGTGLFFRLAHQSSWTQLRPAAAFFPEKRRLLATLKRRGIIRSEADIVAEYGWDSDPTRVIFRKDPDGDVYALMPDDIVDPIGHVSCYQHIGQHSAADYGHCVATSKPATPDEYAELKAELESIGYVVKPVKRNIGAR